LISAIVGFRVFASALTRFAEIFKVDTSATESAIDNARFTYTCTLTLVAAEIGK